MRASTKTPNEAAFSPKTYFVSPDGPTSSWGEEFTLCESHEDAATRYILDNDDGKWDQMVSLWVREVGSDVVKRVRAQVEYKVEVEIFSVEEVK